MTAIPSGAFSTHETLHLAPSQNELLDKMVLYNLEKMTRKIIGVDLATSPDRTAFLELRKYDAIAELKKELLENPNSISWSNLRSEPISWHDWHVDPEVESLRCPICRDRHHKNQPHEFTDFYIQTFKIEHSREPTLADSVSDLSDQDAMIWMDKLNG